ncbi:MAG: lipopolysaccharide biosynthesis protein [Actinomycetota bacterium]
MATDMRPPPQPVESDQGRPGRIARIRHKVFSDGTLTKKASLNTIALALDFAARAIAGLVVNPVLVHYLGDVGYGNWQVLQRLIGHTNPAGGRPSEALKWFVAKHQSSDDVEGKRRAVGSALAVWFVFLPILVPIGAVVGWFAPVWLHVAASDFTMIRLAAAILISDIIVSGLANMPWAVLVGENLGYKRMGLTASIELVAGALIVVAAVLGSSLVGVSVATISTTILSGLLFFWLAKIYVPWFGIARPNIPEVRRFLGLSWWFLVWNFVTKMTVGADVVVLGIAASSPLVTSYTLTRFIPLTITAGVTSVIYGMAPGLGGLIGAGETVRAARVRNETMSTGWLMATVAGAGVLLWERSFLGLWVGAKYYPGLAATVWIVLMVLQYTVIRVDSNIIDLTLNIRRKTLLGLLSAGLSVAFAWILVKEGLGISGVAIGFILGRSVQMVAYPLMIGRILEIPTTTQLRGLARGGSASAALFVAAALLSGHVFVHSWIKLILGAGVSGVVLLAIAFVTGLSPTQRRSLWTRARRVASFR